MLISVVIFWFHGMVFQLREAMSWFHDVVFQIRVALWFRGLVFFSDSCSYSLVPCGVCVAPGLHFCVAAPVSSFGLVLILCGAVGVAGSVRAPKQRKTGAAKQKRSPGTKQVPHGTKT